MEHLTLDREAEVKELETAYPEQVKKLTKYFFGRKCHVVKENEIIYESSVRAQDLVRHYVDLASDERDCLEFVSASGISTHSSFDRDDDNWAGMGRDNLAMEYTGKTNILQENLEKARQELAKTGLKEALEENMVGMKKKRRRMFNEHDGDWDLDRKFDSTPFLATLMSKKEFPYIEIIFPIGMNSGASKEQIAKFAARAMALAEIFELVGYRVAITGEIWNRRLMKGVNDAARHYKAMAGGRKVSIASESMLMMNRLIVREANEYGDIQSFAAFTSGEFFRRTLFGLHYAPAHYIHGQVAALSQEVDHVFGQSLDERPVPASPGQLVINQDLMRKLFDAGKETREEIFKARIQHTVSRSA